MNRLTENIQNVYFLGIGGIGMSALARWFKSRGCQVAGYDRTPSLLTRKMQEEGIEIHFEDDPVLTPERPDLVIYTPAIPANLKELVHFRSTAVPLKKRAEVLGWISKELYTIAIGGTHGKTSISSLCAWIMHQSGLPLVAFIGGISKNLGSNLILDAGARFMIVEADEYDRSFLHLHPDIALISALDADHLDIYGSREALHEAYRHFANLTGPGGLFIQSAKTSDIVVSGRRLTYGLDQSADYRAEDINVQGFSMSFTLVAGQEKHTGFVLSIPGRHNLENALAAVAICHSMGMEVAAVKKAMASYLGVERRFDLRIAEGPTLFLDDYAHHPEEINACIQAVKELYPGKQVTGIFQPHLYTRTRDFAEGFAHSLEKLDKVWLMDIYPARELPIPNVDSSMIMRRMKNPNCQILTRAEILQQIDQHPPEILVTLGAGDIDRLVPDIERLLKNKMTTQA